MKALLGLPASSLFFALLTVCGCQTSVWPASRLEITPAGNFVAWIRTEHTAIPWGPENLSLRERHYVCWVSAEDVANQRKLRVFSWSGAGVSLHKSGMTHISISPDSRHLGVVSGGDIFIIDMKSVAHFSVSARGVSSLGWLDEDHFGYVTYSASSDKGAAHTFWRRSLSDPSQEADIIHQDVDVEGYLSSHWPLEYWSPDGRYVVCQGEGAGIQLLSTETGTVRRLSGGSGELRASWKPDSSAVVWTTSRMRYGHPDNYSTYMLDLVKDEVVDLSTEFRRMFGMERPEYEPLWTADGMFLVGSDLWRGGYLIQPSPWRVVPIGEMLRKEEELDYAPWIRRQPAPGLVVTRPVPDHTWVVNYAGEVVRDLPSDGVFEWTVFPDGRKAAMLNEDMRIVIKQLDLPASERH